MIFLDSRYNPTLSNNRIYMENIIVNIVFSFFMMLLFTYLGYEFYLMLKSHGFIHKKELPKKPHLVLIK